MLAEVRMVKILQYSCNIYTYLNREDIYYSAKLLKLALKYTIVTYVNKHPCATNDSTLNLCNKHHQLSLHLDIKSIEKSGA